MHVEAAMRSGQQNQCQCAAGTSGMQQCADDGRSYSECRCTEGSTRAGSASAIPPATTTPSPIASPTAPAATLTLIDYRIAIPNATIVLAYPSNLRMTQTQPAEHDFEGVAKDPSYGMQVRFLPDKDLDGAYAIAEISPRGKIPTYRHRDKSSFSVAGTAGGVHQDDILFYERGIILNGQTATFSLFYPKGMGGQIDPLLDRMVKSFKIVPIGGQ